MAKTVKEKIKGAEERTNTDPTERQKTSGNYKKGKVTIKGLKISIENPIGTTRSGVSKDGKMWSNKMTYTYGYFNGTIGKDGDPIDVYLGPIIDDDFNVYVIDQVDEETRSFDEHKVMFGFKSEEQAHKAYLSCFNKGWKGFNSVTTMSLNKFKQWLKNADAIKRPAKKLSMSKKMKFKNAVNPRMKVIELSGEVLDDITLEDLKQQAGDENGFDTLIVEIASPGGSVSEGLMIMVWLDYLSQKGKEIITVVTANAYSIASLIMLAADQKMISKHGEVMVHNPMVPELRYANADELEKYASELRDLESIMYELYGIFTGLNKEQIKVLMDNETYLSPEDAIKNKFADIIIDMEPKSFQMTVNNKKEINMSKTLNILNRVIGMVKKADFVNQLYYTEDSGEIEIFQKDPSTYAVGDRTNVKDGEVVLSDGSKLTIVESVITQIDKSVKEEVVEEAPVENVEEVIPVEEIVAPLVEEKAVVELPVELPVKGKDEMPKKVIEITESVKSTKEIIAKSDDEVVAKAEDEKPVAEFNEGPSPKKVAVKDGEEKPVDVVAVELDENGNPIVPVEAGPKSDAMEIIAVLQEGMQILRDQIEQLTESNTQMKKDFEAKFSNMAKFEDVATEAIETLASASSSNFKPKARVPSAVAPTGSIFQNMKKKAGL